MFRPVLIAAALSLAGLAAQADTPYPSPAPVVAAERAFAADGRAHGVRESFLRSVADDGMILRPDPVNAREFLTAQPPDGDGPELFWWPTWVGISAAGDLGVSSGPITIGGEHGGAYFTVWKRQANGQWRWVFDAGSGARGPLPLAAPDIEPAHLPPSVGRAGSPGAAMDAVRALELTLAQGVRTDTRAAYLAVLGQGARILVSRQPPGMDAASYETALSAWPTFEFEPVAGGGSAASADMVWVHGPARWTLNGTPGRGHYVHVWQHQANGWRLIFAEMVASPPPEPAPAPAPQG